MKEPESNMTCKWCHLPIMQGEDFVAFKIYGDQSYSFFHRRQFSNDCYTLFLLDHIRQIKGSVEYEQFS